MRLKFEISKRKKYVESKKILRKKGTGGSWLQELWKWYVNAQRLGLTLQALSQKLGSILRPLRGSRRRPSQYSEPRASPEESVVHPEHSREESSFVHALQDVSEVTKHQK